MICETKRLLIRPISIDDKSELYKYRSDTKANEFQGWIPETIADVEEFIYKTSKFFNEPDTWFQLVIIEKESKKLVGDIGVHFFGELNKQVEIGCTLNKVFQKKGYATESLIKLIDYLFNSLGKHRIIASIDPENLSSVKLVERIGFRKEAHFVESILLNGKWVDDLVYALLQRNWTKDTNL